MWSVISTIRPIRAGQRSSGVVWRKWPYRFKLSGPRKIWRFPNRCATTKPKRAQPVSAMTSFFPSEDRHVRVNKFMRCQFEPCCRISRLREYNELAHEFPGHEAGVVAAEAEGIINRHIDLHLTRGVGDVV